MLMLHYYYKICTFLLFAVVTAGCHRTVSTPADVGVNTSPVQSTASNSKTSTSSTNNNPLVGTWALNRPNEPKPQSEILRFTFQIDGTGRDLIGPFKWRTDSGNKRLILDYDDSKNGTGVKIDLDWAGGSPGDSVTVHFVESAYLADQTLYRQP